MPGPPAGGTDILARLLAEQLSKAFGKPFVIENKAGANGMIGSETVAHAAPDGHTLVFSYAGAMVVNPSLYVRAGFAQELRAGRADRILRQPARGFTRAAGA
ncbi:tripartite tricarboxylate transporter substrate-binding protein [Cupriavidus taiwanensis]|uniref:tripartite tricarboxylate transporter substrate-binding protein n=1 Tax=Cupriavidus taiwanensis TaxID=164546 RepID=UPI0018DB22EF